MKSEFLHEIALAHKACEVAMELGLLAGMKHRRTVGYCAIAATWRPAKSIKPLRVGPR